MAVSQRVELMRGRWTDPITFVETEIGHIDIIDASTIVAMKPYEIPISDEEAAKLLPGDILFLKKTNTAGEQELPESSCTIRFLYKKAPVG